MGGYGIGGGDHGIVKVHHISGFNGACSTSKEGVWGASTVFAFPAAATTLEAISSDAADASAGTGARTIVVEGLDSTYAEISETITLAGLSASSATTASFLRVNRAYVATAGSGNENAGTITIRAASAGATYEVIPIGYNESASAKFTIPLNRVGLLYSVSISTSSPSSATVRLQLEIREQGGLFLVKDVHLVGISGFQQNYDFPLVVPEKADVVVNAVASAAADASVAMNIALRNT